MYLIQTVQTSWRPQLPLPKELQLTDERHSADDDTKANNNNHLNTATTTTTTRTLTESNQNLIEDMERLRNHHQHNPSIGGSSQQLSNKQKWSFGRLFRNKKKEEEGEAGAASASSSEEDRKAGFVPAQRQSAAKSKSKHAGKSQRGSNKSLGFDHIVMSPQNVAPPPPPAPHIDNEFFLPVEMVAAEPYYQNQPGYYNPRSSNSLDRRLYLQPQPAAAAHKSRSAQRGKAVLQPGQPPAHSSEEELISLNSSTFSKYRSDESIHSGGQALFGVPGQSRRSRAARNERYYKRLSRDGEVSHGGVPVQQQQQQQIQQQQQLQQQQPRYKTQPLPLSIYQAPPATSGYVQWQPQVRPLQNSMQNDGKRSISYDSHIHMQNVGGRMQSKPLPPPPPPRDPLRRVHVMGSSSGDLRPVSYAFDQSGRCVSDDRIWQPPHYQSVHSLNSQPSSSIASAPPVQQGRRFITRAERNALPGKKSLPNGIDFHYVADATPRSRKPIHMLESTGNAVQHPPASSGVLRTSKSGLPTANDCWQQQQQPQPPQRPQQPLTKPRSISSSRLSELRTYPMPMYSEVLKPKRAAPPPAAVAPEPTDQQQIICGSLHIKPSDHASQNYVEIRHRDVHKTNSMPHHYQRRSGEDLPNKYEEYVAEKREQHQQAPAPVFPERKASAPVITPVYFPRKKPANLEEAINELEAIYKSLGLTEPPEPKPEPKQEPKPRVPTPSDFEKFALAHADEYDDEDSPAGEPDPVRDDVAYRNLQLSNLQHRAAEKQPPFGIPVGPIVPAPQSDYLHVEPVRVPKKKSGSPDIVKDDLAVRALRKDPPGPKSSFVYPMQKKQRATRTQSANIYNLIQRDAAKPSGGDLSSYMELTRNIERAGSMSNLAGTETSDTSDVPATLDLLRKLKAQDEELNRKPHIPFRHPSQGGAIAQLPDRLSHEETPKLAPVPAPRKSLTPEPLLEDALNKIAQDAQASSIKLSQELKELRKEALITAARPKMNAEQQKLEQELQQIEAVSEAAKRCGQLLLDTLPDNDELQDVQQSQQQQQHNPRKLHKEGKLIRAIDEVSEAANAVCDKILKDIVTTEPPVVVHEALQVKQHATDQLVMPLLIKKLDPIQSDKIEAIAKRCMRQLSELAESQPDYDNLSGCNAAAVGGGVATVHADATLICPIAEDKTRRPQTSKTRAQQKSQALEDIDKIMQECERQAKCQTGNSSITAISSTTTHTTNNNNNNSSTDDQRTTAPSMSSGSVSGSGGNATTVSTTASSFSSSSDCLAKSSSPSTASRPLSSSITSFNPYSSSDYIKSQSSDYHAPSTDPIKTFSTTSYDVQSTPNNSTINSTNTQSTLSSNSNSTTNNNNSSSNITSCTTATSEHQTASVATPSSSPPLQLTPVSERRARSSSPSQYNSSEELAAIFGIEEQPKQLRRKQQPATLTTTTTGKAAAPAPEKVPASSDAATNPRCAVPAIATNPVMNVELELELAPAIDVTTTTSSSSSNCSTTIQSIPTNDSARSSSNCSSHSCKLATIPELDPDELESELQSEVEAETETCLKLSPNFNRIYASKINIVMDKSATPAAAIEPVMTQFDSLSSLEETSSNPDSGNASLADFPLVNQANATIELQTTYNSRFEVREHYVSEVSISASKDETDNESVRVRAAEREQDFPRLPTAEELLDSLREQAALDESESKSETKEQTLDETKSDSLKLDEAVYDVTTELLQTAAAQQAELDEDEDELDYSRLVELALEEALDEEMQNESELNESDVSKCIVYETPQINLSISELKLNYETKVEQEATTLDEANKASSKGNEENDKDEESDEDDMPISDTSARKEQESSGAKSETNNETETRLRKGLPAARADEQPTTSARASESESASAKALSVFGEVRTLQAAPAAAGGGAREGSVMRGGLTTLEHVLVACTVGLITPNDLLTLCLIVIAVIIIVAIALT